MALLAKRVNAFATSSTWTSVPSAPVNFDRRRTVSTIRRSPVARAHGLHGLAFSAIGRAPQRPVIEFANGVARIPELRCNSAVAGIFQHADLLAAFDLPADFRRKLKLVAAVIDGPGAICFHQDSVVSVGDQIVILPGTGE